MGERCGGCFVDPQRGAQGPDRRRERRRSEHGTGECEGIAQGDARASHEASEGRRGSAAEKAVAFEGMAAQINELSGGTWNAARSLGADGSRIFAGEFGEALVVSPSGGLFRGSLLPSANSFSGGLGRGVQPDYSALRKL